jgi:hypothetical protein
MKNVETADAEILKNRQERLNKRKLTGKIFIIKIFKKIFNLCFVFL